MLHLGSVSTQDTGHPGIGALPIARQIPRLADFRFHDKSSLVSLVVIRGVVRALDFAAIVVIGLAIALLYVDEPIIVGRSSFLLAVSFVGLAAVAIIRVAQPLRAPRLHLLH